MLIRQLRKRSDVGLVIDWKFHRERRWVSALTPYLVDAIVAEFNPLVISSQFDYNVYKRRLKYIISMEPGWAAPRLRYDTDIRCQKAVFYSDPHHETEARYRYFKENDFQKVFSYYKRPFFYHFKGFPPDQFVHMPWAIPNDLISRAPIDIRNAKVGIFGGKNSPAYDVRNWCREQSCVENFEFSGVENKKMNDEEYFQWLARWDALVAAGSSDPAFDMVTPKYFEIASAGALLFAHRCADLPDLGFDSSNSIIFDRSNFLSEVSKFKSSPEKFLEVRKAGRDLIMKSHKVSDRVSKIKEALGRP